MKRTLRFLVLCFFPLLIIPRLNAVDLELSGGLGNLSFDTDRKSTLGSEDKAFDHVLFPLISAAISGEAGSSVYYRGGYERDPILRNRLFASLGLRSNNVSLEAGPFLGIYNTGKLELNPGFTAALGLQFPGILFVNLEASSSIGNILETPGAYSQKTSLLSAGFWVPHVICSLNLNSRSFTLEKNTNLLEEDSLDRYFFRADVYTKNVPYTIQVDMGYEILKRSYVSQNITGTNFDDLVLNRDLEDDTFKAFFLGLQMNYTINPVIKLVLGGEMPVYYWSAQPMKTPGKGTFLFQARAGIILTLP